MSEYPRISDMNIEDDIIRTSLYRDVFTYINSDAAITREYEIKPDEEYRPDLVAFRVYSNIDTKWLVMLICDIEDDEYPLPVGTVFRFPSLTYVRERIRHYAAGGGIDG